MTDTASDAPRPVRPEMRLLLCCASGAEATARRDCARAALGQVSDWDCVLAEAEDHGLTPLLHELLETLDDARVPEAVRTTAAEHYRAAALRARMLVAELHRVLALLEGAGIGAVPYKGPVLAATVYANAALRPFGDLDILIREADVAAAGALLQANGLARKIPPLTTLQERFFVRTDHEHEFISADGLVNVDLHWRLSTQRFPFRMQASRLWSRIGSCTLAGRTVPTLGVADQILFLCMHGCKDLWRRLVWLADIDRLVRAHADDIDWPALFAQARRSHCRRMVNLGLHLVHELLATPLPEVVAREIERDRSTAGLAREVHAMVFGGKMEERGIYACLGIRRLHLHACDGPRDRLRYVVRTLITPTERDWASRRVPDALFFLYYVMRLVRRFGRCLRGLVAPGN